MEIRKAVMDDLEPVMNLYAYARKFMAAHGNEEQWGDGYPQEEIVKQDILAEECYVCIENGKIACVFTFFIGEDPTYLEIHNGEWVNNEKYGVVHRVASAEGTKGAATFALNWCYRQWANLRMDTHEKNIPMQNFLKKMGFVYCGIIYTRERSKRLVFQKNAQAANWTGGIRMKIKRLEEEELKAELFDGFERFQKVEKCWRKEKGE